MTRCPCALAAIKAVKKEGKGNDDAGPAWKTLVSKGRPGPPADARSLRRRQPDRDQLAPHRGRRHRRERERRRPQAPGRRARSVRQEQQVRPSARRRAYELLVAHDPTAKDRLLPGFLNDKSADLRRDAIAAELDILEKADRPTIKADLEKLFALHPRQGPGRSARQEDRGERREGQRHRALRVRHPRRLVGPFDSPGGKGFDTAYPPETATDASGKFKGKGGRELKWKPASTTDKYGKFDLNKLLGKHKDAVAYALAVMVAEKETPCDIRVTSINVGARSS